MSNKVIQIPIDEKLLKELNSLCKNQRKSRSELIRYACQRYIKQVEKEKLVRAYIKGYLEIPEEPELGEAMAIMASEILPEESW
jgi:metal-responsive CopG/Arc/MetJ family transcriptional regulator